MKILFIGDIVGRPGREAVKKILPELIKKEEIDFVIANGENLAHGKGMTKKTYQEMREAGIDCFTSGNHIWAKKEFIPFLEDKKIKVLRPANYPPAVIGRGYEIFEVGTQKLAVVSLMGRVFFPIDLDCPFRKLDEILQEIGKMPTIIDFHAEATSEKRAFGFYAQNRVSAVICTHTHIPSADEEIMGQKTAYISDVGMVGPHNSVLGVEKELIIDKFLTQILTRHEIAEGEVEFNAVLLEIDRKGAAKSIKRVREIIVSHL
ncbi:TIGR00282 family metallophosphoesterase [Patescibacteria group bacterium]|nr:TIGR00282 family metallophosphoesterase [Patescibacteria group bacterium]